MCPGEEGCLEGRNAPQPPQEARDPLGKLDLDRAVRRKLCENAGAQIGEVFERLAGEEAAMACQPMGDGVAARGRFSFRSFGACRCVALTRFATICRSVAIDPPWRGFTVARRK